MNKKINIYKIVMFEWKCTNCLHTNITDPTVGNVTCERCGKSFSVKDEAYIS